MRSMYPVAAVAAVLLAVAACGNSADDDPDSSAAEQVEGEVGGAITVWTWEGAPGEDAMAALAEGFEAETGVTVENRIISRDEYTAQVQLGLNSGDAPDVLGVQPSQFATEVQPNMRPVSSYVDLLDGGLDAYSQTSIDQIDRLYDGDEAYSVPLASTGSAVCFYNGDLLEQAGVEPPSTWEEVATLTERLAEVAPDALTLVKPSGSDSWFEDEFLLTLVGQQDPGFFDALRYDDAALNTDSYVEALTRYGALYEDETLQRDALDLGYADAMTAFSSGQAAIVCNGSWEGALLRADYREENQIDISSVGAIPVPADSADDRSARGFLDITWGIPTDAANPATAAAFISYATQGDGVNLWAESLGFVPALDGWELDEAVLGDDEVARAGYEQIVELINDPSSDRNNLSSLSAQLGTYVIEVAQGRLTPQEAADKGEEDRTSGLYDS